MAPRVQRDRDRRHFTAGLGHVTSHANSALPIEPNGEIDLVCPVFPLDFCCSSGAVSWLPSNARGIRGHAPTEDIFFK